MEEQRSMADYLAEDLAGIEAGLSEALGHFAKAQGAVELIGDEIGADARRSVRNSISEARTWTEDAAQYVRNAARLLGEAR